MIGCCGCPCAPFVTTEATTLGLRDDFCTLTRLNLTGVTVEFNNSAVGIIFARGLEALMGSFLNLRNPIPAVPFVTGPVESAAAADADCICIRCTCSSRFCSCSFCLIFC